MGKYFTVGELCESSTAKAKGIKKYTGWNASRSFEKFN